MSDTSETTSGGADRHPPNRRSERMSWLDRIRPKAPLHIRWTDSDGDQNVTLWHGDTFTLAGQSGKPILKCEYTQDGLHMTSLTLWATISEQQLRNHLAYLARVQPGPS